MQPKKKKILKKFYNKLFRKLAGVRESPGYLARCDAGIFDAWLC
jgi:hypothetical protein